MFYAVTIRQRNNRIMLKAVYSEKREADSLVAYYKSRGFRTSLKAVRYE